MRGEVEYIDTVECLAISTREVFRLRAKDKRHISPKRVEMIIKEMMGVLNLAVEIKIKEMMRVLNIAVAAHAVATYAKSRTRFRGNRHEGKAWH